MDNRVKTLENRVRMRLERVVLLWIICVLINLGGSWVTGAIGFPLYLDSIGTVLAAVISGPLPGIAVGLITNMIKSFANYISFYYGALNVLIAVVSAFLVSKGFLKKVWKIMIFILSLAFVGGVLGSVITWFLFGFASEGISAELASHIYENFINNMFVAQFSADFIIDIADKTITTLVVIIVMKILPDAVEERFRYDGWQQRPLSKEMIAEFNRTKKRKVPLRAKILLLITVATVIVAIIATMIGYFLFKNSTIDDHERLAQGVAELAASIIDGDKVDEYIEGGESAPGYSDTEKLLYGIRDSSPDIYYLYVYKIEDEGCRVVFDLDTEEVEGSEPGELMEFDPSFKPLLQDLKAGKEIEPIISNDSFGWLMTVYTPVYNSDGECVCYACADISMDQLVTEGYAFLIKQISLFLGYFILVLAVGVWLAEYNITYPVNAMAFAASAFAYKSEDERNENVKKIKDLDIHTGDEIENLYNAFKKTTEDSMQYVADIQTKNQEISNMQNGLIFVLSDMVESRDQCTGDHIKKTAAYVGIILRELKRMGKYPELLTDDYIEDVISSAPLHDIGKIKISDVILNKPGRFTDEEFEIMKTHTTAGGDIIDQAIENISGHGYLSEAKNVAEYHHEKWNGKGYPHGLSGEDIPLSARVMAVADVFDALVSKRIYKDAYSFEKALEIIKNDAGTHFDPTVAEAFLNCEEEVRRVAEGFKEEGK